MAVQLHLYGSRFDLDTDHPDAFWIEHVEAERARANDVGVTMLSVDLDDGRVADIQLARHAPLVVVTDQRGR